MKTTVFYQKTMQELVCNSQCIKRTQRRSQSSNNRQRMIIQEFFTHQDLPFPIFASKKVDTWQQNSQEEMDLYFFAELHVTQFVYDELWGQSAQKMQTKQPPALRLRRPASVGFQCWQKASKIAAAFAVKCKNPPAVGNPNHSDLSSACISWLKPVVD